jgi:ankyrin repeat protein
MRLIRHVYFLSGIIPCLLFLSLGTAYSQQIHPRGYLFVEVTDTSGRVVEGATVTFQNAVLRTDKAGVVEARTDLTRADRQYYEVQVSAPGYLTSSHIFFPYISPALGDDLHLREEFVNSVENPGGTNPLPIRIALVRNPVTPAERRAVIVEEQKRQLLSAAKRGDPVNLRSLLEAGGKADTMDAKGVPAIAWAAFGGNAETINILLDAGADVQNKNTLGHQALLIYLTDGITRDRDNKAAGVVEQREQIVRKLLAAGAGVNVQSPYRGRVLNRAITQAPYALSIEAIKLLLTAGANANAVDAEGQTPLMLAADIGSAEITRLLLGAGGAASINAKDKQGKTALMYLPRYPESKSDVARVLVTAGANVNEVNEAGQTALMSASVAGSTEVTRVLLESSAAVNVKDKQGMTALMYSAKSASADISKVLIEGGASINEKDARGWPALMYASAAFYSNSGPAVVSLLIAARANVNAVNEDGQTALMLAAPLDVPETIKLLLAAGASVDAIDKQGQTVLMHACQASTRLDVEPFIKAGAGATVNQKDARGWTALMYAVPRYNGLKDAELLIAAGANVNDANAEGQTVLMLAAKTGPVEVLRLLLESGAIASVNAKDNEGKTALIQAANYSQDVEVIRVLIEAGADVNQAAKDGQTPLMGAVAFGPIDGTRSIELLLKAGAKTDLTDSKGQTALGLAKQFGRLTSVRLLEEAGARH